MKRGILLLMLLPAIAWASPSLPSLDGDKLAVLDSYPGIVSKLPADHMSKLLIEKSAADQGKLINLSVLNKAIVDLINDGSAQAAIVKDLGTGDDRLRANLMGTLAAFNVAPDEAAGLILAWSKGKNTEALSAVLANAENRPEVMERMGEYFMGNDLEWVRSVDAISLLLSGKEKDACMALAVAISNATGTPLAAISKQIDLAQSGDITAKWNLAFNVEKVITGKGAIARVITASPLTGDSFYEKVWNRVAHIIAADPDLMSEYAHRTTLLTPLYDAMSVLMINALSAQTPISRSIGQEILRRSDMPGRFSWIAKQALGPKQDAGEEQAGSGEKADIISQNIASMMKADAGWSDLMFWFMTRVGEAVVSTTRSALPDSIKDDDNLALAMIRAQQPFSSEFAKKLSSTHAYSYYKEGERELREKVASGQVEQGALHQYMSEFAYLLSTDDAAWDDMFIATEKSESPLVREIICESIDRSVKTSAAWFLTMQNNDPQLRAGYLKWLVQAGGASSAQEASLWLSSVTEAIKGENVVGNPEIAKAKETFIKFLHTDEGWGLARRRIEVESYGFPDVLRELMVEKSISSPEEFWPIYSMLVNANDTSTSLLKENLTAYVLASSLPSMVVDEAAQQNPYAADASSPVWAKVMDAGSGLPTELQRLVDDGMTDNDSYGLANKALVDITVSDAGWALIKPYAAAFFEASDTDPALKDKTVQLLSATAGKATTLATHILEDTKINEMWRARCLVLIQYMGKGAAGATVVRENPAIMKEWRMAASSLASSDPKLLPALVESLGKRRLGDLEFTSQVSSVRRDLARMVFCDRILFEQLINDKNADFRKTLWGEVSALFGVYIKEQWQ